MELNENLNTSLNLVTKYEIYRIIKLYSYLFILTSVSLILFSFYDTDTWISGISLFLYLALFVIPMVYTFILYFVIKGKTPYFEFEISLSHLIIPVLCILAVLFLFPAIIYILIFPMNQDFFGNLYNFLPLEILFPYSFSLIINFFLVKRLKHESNGYVFFLTGVILFLIWIAELLTKMYDIITYIYFIIGIILYIYSLIFLKR